MTARGFALVFGAALLVVAAAWLWFDGTTPHGDAAITAAPQPEPSTPGDAELDDWPAGFGEGEPTRAAATPPDADPLRVDPTAAPAQVRVVVSLAGAPFAKPARVVFTRDSGRTPIHEYGARAEFAWPGDSGEIAITIAGGLWTVRAESDDLASLPRTVRVPTSSGEPLSLALEPQCRWYGALLTTADDPAAGVTVRVVSREGNELDATRSDPGGRFELRAVQRPGSRIEVGDPSRAVLVHELAPDCGAAQLGALKLPPLASLTLEFDRAGHEHDAVQVMLQGFRIDENGGSSVRVFAAGEPVRFDDLAPGRFRVYVYVPGARGNLNLKLVPGAQTAAVSLRATRPPR